ncbi:MAG: cation:proton antiporter [Candidatus Heimdallarchaeota archaeon]|nr:cation:proton antiporter [Candidatus Heimdallarchaeota archaeon]MCK4770641.1 cation:proton antiporter [Candidatus Heimdallarchaeota archaeon]
MMPLTQIGYVIMSFGGILVVGFIGAKILKRINIPQVLGFILMGILLGLPNRYIREFIPYSLIDQVTPILVTVALGIIGFNIGAELSWKELKKIDRKLLIVLIADSIGTFLVITVLVGVVTTRIYGDPIWWNFAFILGALGSATAPAATADVLWEYDSKGPLTQAVLFILAVDDIISILLVQITTNVTEAKLPNHEFSTLSIFAEFSLEIFAAIGIGIVAGVVITWAINRVKDYGEIMEIIIGTLIVIIGVTLTIESSAILGAMFFGIVIATFTKSKKKTDHVFHEIFKIGSPIVALFFIIVGFSVNPADLKYIGIIGALYLVGRTIGKVGFVSITARALKTERVIGKYLGFTLFSQAGVALGLAVSIAATFRGTIYESQANLILSTITGTIIIVQIIGPLLVRWSIHRAGEVGGRDEQLHLAEAMFAEEKVIKFRDKIKRTLEKRGFAKKNNEN